MHEASKLSKLFPSSPTSEASLLHSLLPPNGYFMLDDGGGGGGDVIK